MEQLTQFFKALSDEIRLRIMMLLTQGELCVCDLMYVLDEPQSKVSRHLAYLKHSGITESKRAGVWMHYRLKDSQNGIYKAQIDFLKMQLSHFPQFREDKDKLLELKKQGSCKALMKLKKVRKKIKRRI
ncbi:MAG: metalloregulator ArsR/SmtB family transcription factor [Syntrophaceae bacterium]|nr:metalloregulator ArsR/SmtB family transcription factor [Syntrophaceae bacterium]